MRNRPLPDISAEDRAYAHSLIIYEDSEVIVFDKPSGLAVQGATGRDQHPTVGGVELKRHTDGRQHQRMAQGNQVCTFFGGLYACDSGDSQHIPFFMAAAGNQGQGISMHADFGFSRCDPRGDRLAADINHARMALGIQVG